MGFKLGGDCPINVDGHAFVINPRSAAVFVQLVKLFLPSFSQLGVNCLVSHDLLSFLAVQHVDWESRTTVFLSAYLAIANQRSSC